MHLWQSLREALVGKVYKVASTEAKLSTPVKAIFDKHGGQVWGQDCTMLVDWSGFDTTQPTYGVVWHAYGTRVWLLFILIYFYVF